MGKSNIFRCSEVQMINASLDTRTLALELAARIPSNGHGVDVPSDSVHLETVQDTFSPAKSINCSKTEARLSKPFHSASD